MLVTRSTGRPTHLAHSIHSALVDAPPAPNTLNDLITSMIHGLHPSANSFFTAFIKPFKNPWDTSKGSCFHGNCHVQKLGRYVEIARHILGNISSWVERVRSSSQEGSGTNVMRQANNVRPWQPSKEDMKAIEVLLSQTFLNQERWDWEPSSNVGTGKREVA